MSGALIRSLDERKARFVGEVPRIFSCLAVDGRGNRPEADTKGKAVEDVVRGARAFRCQSWKVIRLKRETQEDQVWRIKAARVWMSSAEGWSEGTYWLIWACNDETGGFAPLFPKIDASRYSIDVSPYSSVRETNKGAKPQRPRPSQAMHM